MDRSVRRRVHLAWGLLYLNTLTYVAILALLPFPSTIGKALAQVSLPVAVVVLLSLNGQVVVRPNVFMFLMSLLAVDTFITCLWPMQLGPIFRTVRLAVYLVALWLLTPWWGRRDMLVMRCHLRFLFASVCLTLLGMLIAPGRAFAFDGRLTGIIWPMFPTQVAHYAALAMGLSAMLWLGREVRWRTAVVAAAVCVPALLLTHTRTALLAMVAGLLVAGLSLFVNNSRVRRFFLAAVVAGGAVTLVVADVVTTWLTRGQNAEGLTTLTGRTNFWALVLDEPRNRFEMIFGFGLSNASVNGLPIDSNWLAAYQQEGLVGVVLCAAVLLWLFVTALLQPPSLPRAIALFLLTYCLLASATEDAFTNASTYLLDMVVAASLLVAAPRPDGRR